MSQSDYGIVYSICDCKEGKAVQDVGNQYGPKTHSPVFLDRHPNSSGFFAALLMKKITRSFLKGCKRSHNLCLCICEILTVEML